MAVNYEATAHSSHTTVKQLVDKSNSMRAKMDSVLDTIISLQGRGCDYSEALDRASKDKRYVVQLLLQDYRRIEADLQDLENAPVRFLRD